MEGIDYNKLEELEKIKTIFGYAILACSLIAFTLMCKSKNVIDYSTIYLNKKNQVFYGVIVKRQQDKASHGDYTIWFKREKYVIPEEIYHKLYVGDSVVKSDSRYYVVFRNGQFFDTLDLNKSNIYTRLKDSHYSIPSRH